ncbi:MAG: hypothetical protein OXF93_16250 [Acidobacteria bacterium]|nr:hypothetical protein [Acidobacteriota bacterium]
MQHPPADRTVDWTGVQPDRGSVEPLDGRTFVARLRRLEACARDLTLLRKARADQQSNDDRLLRDAERTPRPPR